MSETRFTPGPWVAEPLKGGYYNVGIRVRGENVSGYTCVMNTRWMHLSQQVEQIANVNLISCAPDLYAFAAAQLAEMDFRADPAEREKRADLFALLQRVRGE